MKTVKKVPPKLPDGITKTDLKVSHWKNWDKERLTKDQVVRLQELGLEAWCSDFELWNVDGLGWVIPTLNISSQTRSGSQRTYAVGVVDEKTYRVGHGPHVGVKHTVRLTKQNFDRLFKFISLKALGLRRAHQVRDRISSRRAQGQVFRALGKRHWLWNDGEGSK